MIYIIDEGPPLVANELLPSGGAGLTGASGHNTRRIRQISGPPAP